MEQEKIIEIIANQMGVDENEITLETKLSEDLGADSLDIYQIISVFEEEFGIQFSNEDTEKVKTIGDIVSYIKEQKK